MIKTSTALELLTHLLGEELTSTNLHEALLVEPEHKKALQRFWDKKAAYVTFSVHEFDAQKWASISISGSPDLIRLRLNEIGHKLIVTGVGPVDSTQPPHGLKNQKSNRVVTFRLMLTPFEREQLNQLASDAGQTASQYVRSVIFPKS
jgi:hypothetical protein